MAKIPMGDFGNVVANPAPQVQANPNDFGAATGQALQQLGAQGQALAGQQIQEQQRLNDDLQRTKAANAFQTHETNVKTALADAGTKLQSGELDQLGYTAAVNDAKQQSYDSTIGQLPDNHYRNIATVQTQGLDRAVDLTTQSVLTKNTQQQIAANAGAMLDTAGKSIAVDPNTINDVVSATVPAYLKTAQIAGIPQPQATKQAQDWQDAQYTQHAMSAAINARSTGNLATLNQLQHDLTAPDGFYAGKLDANQRNRVLSTVVSQQSMLQNQQASEQNARENGAVDWHNKTLELLESGKQLSPEYTQQLVAATAGTQMEGPVKNLIAQAAQNAGFATMSLPQQAAVIQQERAAAATPGVGTDPDTQAMVKRRVQINQASVEAYKQDPWNAALDRGAIVNVPPLDTSSIPNLLNGLQQRVANIGVVEDKAGRKISPFTPAEAGSVLQMVNSLPVEAKGAALQDLGQAIGDPARIGDLAEQWKEKDPAMSLAMKFGAAGNDGRPLLTTNGVPVASFILAGDQAKKDQTVKIDETADAGLRSKIAQTINGTLPPLQSDDAKQAAYYIALGTAARNGRTALNASDIQTAIDTATGGISNTGGYNLSGKTDLNRVARPYGWTDDQYQGGVKAATPANIENQIGGKPIDTVIANGQQVPVDQFMAKFPSYQLVRVGLRGSYAIQAGSKFVTDKTGAPVTVQLNMPSK